MSRYKGNSDKCPHCGLTYGRFRTGFDYREVFEMLWDSDPDSASWKYKRRNTILGKWFELKQELWLYHIESDCHELVPF